MADLNERLERLVSDQDSMKKVLELAQNILAQREAASATSAQTEEPAEQAPDMSAVLSSLLGNIGTDASEADTSSPHTVDAPPQGAAMLASVLPQLMQVLSGQEDLVKPERATLVRAIGPYLKTGRLNSIERALRMANLTKAATNALHTLGR